MSPGQTRFLRRASTLDAAVRQDARTGQGVASHGLPSRQSFVAIFSDAPFTGHQFVLEWLEERDGGNVYGWEGLSGWLCPALFDYFATAPRHIHLQLREK